jgi:hypothetical protein
MSFLSREEFKELYRIDPDRLYDFLTEKFASLEKKKCSCGHCNISPNAPEIKNRTFYGNNFRALILYLKNQQMLPFHRTKQIIKDY